MFRGASRLSTLFDKLVRRATQISREGFGSNVRQGARASGTEKLPFEPDPGHTGAGTGHLGVKARSRFPHRRIPKAAVAMRRPTVGQVALVSIPIPLLRVTAHADAYTFFSGSCFLVPSAVWMRAIFVRLDAPRGSGL